MLENEVRLDLDIWERRLKTLLYRSSTREEPEDQEDLFSPQG
jgi:hypothetical protein